MLHSFFFFLYVCYIITLWCTVFFSYIYNEYDHVFTYKHNTYILVVSIALDSVTRKTVQHNVTQRTCYREVQNINILASRFSFFFVCIRTIASIYYLKKKISYKKRLLDKSLKELATEYKYISILDI